MTLPCSILLIILNKSSISSYLTLDSYVKCCRTVNKITSTVWFLSLSILMRLIAGIGTSMVGVAGTSILLKSTTYSASTVGVGTSFIYLCYL